MVKKKRLGNNNISLFQGHNDRLVVIFEVFPEKIYSAFVFGIVLYSDSEFYHLAIKNEQIVLFLILSYRTSSDAVTQTIISPAPRESVRSLMLRI